MKNFIIPLIATTFLMNIAIAQKTVLRTFAEKSNLKGHVKSVQEGKYYLEEYDKQGNRTATTYFNTDGSIESILKYKYGKPRLVTEITTYDASNKLKHKTIFEYDNNDNEINSTTYDSEGKITYQNITRYTDSHHYTIDLTDKGKTYKTKTIITDNNNNIIEEITTTDGKTYAAYIKKTFSYKPGMTKPYLTQSFDATGKLDIEIQDDFDSNGNSIKHVEKGYGQTQITTFEYTYDAKGNYTKKIAKGYSQEIYQRTITYY